MTLMKTLLQAGATGSASFVLSESPYINDRDIIPTPIPLLNIALGVDPLDGGMMPGITIFAGERATFKTRLGMELVAAYMAKYPDGICQLYDSEFGASLAYFTSVGIDMNRVIHTGIEHIEQLKFDMSKKLEQIKRGDRIIFFIDSIGMLASKKEIEDATKENVAADMTRAKALRSFFRIITPHMVMKNIPTVIIAHTYQTMDGRGTVTVSGGTAPMYAANEVFNITKAKERDGDKSLIGYDFNMRVLKSRLVREESVFPISVSFEHGILRNSGLVEIGRESGIVEMPSKGWYTTPFSDKKMRYDDLLWDDPTWDRIIEMPEFREYVKKRYALAR